MTSSERQLEEELIAKLKELKYRYREDVHDRATLEANFRDQFQQLNRVKLTDEEFQRLLEEIITPDVFTAAQTVVDRKDLDRQTRKEFKRFQEGCVEANTNTGFLVQRLISDDAADKVIVCTVQRLGLALDENSKRNKSREKRGLATYVDQLEALRDKHTVFIFDECHRSQFGDNHQAIKEFFPQAQILGFTGTPIFEANASTQQISGEEKTLKTTQDLFQPCLHEYTITPTPSRITTSCAFTSTTTSRTRHYPRPSKARRSLSALSSTPFSPNTTSPRPSASSTSSSPDSAMFDRSGNGVDRVITSACFFCACRMP